MPLKYPNGKSCESCGEIIFNRRGPKKFCGNKLSRTGCAYKMKLARDKKYKAKAGFKPVRRYGRTSRLLKLRFLVLQKFAFTCQYCGRKAPDVSLQIDHVMPKSRGGTNSMGNYTVACLECNVGKKDIILDG